MRLALIAHGFQPIPPRGWGAVEETVWNHKIYLERLGHSVDIFNTRALHTALHEINNGNYDFAHCHNEMFVLNCVAHLRVPLAVTSHTAVSKDASGKYEYRGAAQYLFKNTLQAPANIVLSEQIKATYERAGYRGLLRVLPNGAEVEKYRIADRGNGRAICLGRISQRKRQAWLSKIVGDRVPVDFVGPWDPNKEPAFAEHKMAHYLGAWDRATVHDHLTDYSCLVLLSKAEGAVKVVPEALAAGLSVVISEVCATNLTEEEFITVIPGKEERPEVIAQAIHAAIEKNTSLRKEIRSYAKERFDYAVLCKDYVRIIDEVREQYLAIAAFAPLQALNGRGETAARGGSMTPPNPWLRWVSRCRTRSTKGPRPLPKRFKKRLRGLSKKLRVGRLRTHARPLVKMGGTLVRSLAHQRFARKMAKTQKEVSQEPARPWASIPDSRFRRLERFPVVHSLAEIRLAVRFHWDLNVFRGRSSAAEARRGNIYQIINPHPLIRQVRPKIETVRLPYWLRFGNAVQQLRNIFQVAEQLGARTVQFEQTHPFFAGDRAGDLTIIWGEEPDSAPTLEGEFFNIRAFRINSSASEIARVFIELVRPLLTTFLRDPDPRVRSDDLVLHFRAGDVFRRSKAPHQRYGQPPLSYYLAAVEQEQPRRVWLVFEDRGNPCIEAAETALNARGVEVLVQSGTLAEDLRVMFSARRLAAGRGSFAYMIAHLSGLLRKVYFFEKGGMDALQELGLEVIVARDVAREYKDKLLRSNWVGSEEQRVLMLSYPAKKLKFTRCARASFP
jgi:glycosyltransferase involved in cell wall biosynthesis